MLAVRHLRLDLKAPAVPRSDTDHTGPSISPASMPMARSPRASGSGQDAIPNTSAHAAAWLRLRPSQRRPRHTGATGLARPQEHPAHGALYRVGTASVQGLLALTLP